MYIQLNSQVICYEKCGQGPAVLLLHGNGEDHHIFDELVDELKSNHTVIAMDSRGHGESATPKEYHYDDMANDVVNLIEAIEIEKPTLVGFSDGGIVALLVAMKRSDLLSSLVVCGANLSPKGLKFSAAHEIKKQFKKDKSPITEMMLKEPDIKAKDLAKISVPVTIIAGEKDMIKEDETKLIASSIKNSKLVILKGQTHSSYVEHKTELAKYI